MLGSLLKAAVGIAIDLPVSAIKDTLTLGGALTDEESAIADSCKTIVENVKDAVDPDKDLMD